ncbi:MAG: PKD domain-containing protein [Saprospiraceae bacterium]
MRNRANSLVTFPTTNHKRFGLVIYFLIAIFLAPVSARHIIGGVITYTCQGNGNYNFTMKIYRDFYGGGALFDDPAQVAVYQCGTNTPCDLLNVNNAIQVLSVPLSFPVIQIANPTYPCLLVPPNIQVEEGVYYFSLNLPQSPESYHIVYQRCCRNNTITNIYNPEDTGASFSVEITPAAQALCNDSPVFDDFPPTVICAGEPLSYMHSATDPDGDQLVYEFCAPIKGGGPFGTPDNPGNASACNGVAPFPPCPPPYDPVDYILPTYSPTAPLAGNPVVSIDPNTGLITGTPQTQGQFVVGVCVYEYRNGQLLSVIRRDFQFNVESCEQTVVADILEDEIVGDQAFLVNSCGNNVITFQNQSYQEPLITSYLWEFDIQGTKEIVTTKNATITFPGVGQYQGIMAINPGSNCGDTATIFVNVFPAISADFAFEYDTCTAGEVAFQDLSVTGSNQMVSWDWTFEPGATSVEQDPAYQFPTPGVKAVTLTVQDINDCEAQITQNVNWFPVPPLLIIEPSAFSGCQPGEIFFNNLSSPIDETYLIEWDFGDGTKGSEISPTHTYETAGTFSVTVEVTSPIGCTTDAFFPDWITIDPSPIADFTFSPPVITSLNPTVDFTDLSTGADRWLWQFDEDGTSKLQNPSFTFPDTGFQKVLLTVTHPSGCQDTLVRYIDVIPEVRYFLPNAFTPNSDGLNDFFIGRGLTDGMKFFQMRIYNRWGELLFESDDPESGWDGRIMGRSEPVQPGVYLYQVDYRDSRGNDFTLSGFATLVL